jgi:predicted phage tail protein
VLSLWNRGAGFGMTTALICVGLGIALVGHAQMLAPALITQPSAGV